MVQTLIDHFREIHYLINRNTRSIPPISEFTIDVDVKSYYQLYSDFRNYMDTKFNMSNYPIQEGKGHVIPINSFTIQIPYEFRLTVKINEEKKSTRKVNEIY